MDEDTEFFILLALALSPIWLMGLGIGVATVYDLLSELYRAIRHAYYPKPDKAVRAADYYPYSYL